MVQLQEVTKAFGDRTLLERVTWQVGDRDRVGLCGPNGAGKTTLLRMLAGLEPPDGGVIQKPNALTIGYLPQDGLTYRGRTVFDEACQALEPLLDLKTEMHALEEQLADESLSAEAHVAALHRYSEVQERFRIGDGYQIELKVATVLNGLGFGRETFNQLTDHLSGGWQMRLALGKLLLSEPDLLLLDEPTNHLDLEARNWLEAYLVQYPGAVILVSHDRYFLDAVVTRIADLSLRTITDYHSNYSQYVVERDARLARLREARRQQDEEIARVEQFINRFRYQATKAKQVQSRIKLLEKVVRIEVPPERQRIRFHFPAAARSGRMVLELSGARKAYGDHVVLDGVNLHIERGDRIALVGPNGSGKSTLMRLLSGEEPPDAGARREGHQVVLQYFAQDEATRLDPRLTVYETLSAHSPHAMVPAIRHILGGFLFSGDDVYKKVEVLSGGERTRLAVARMLLRPSNTLLLDEPTNHLDLDSKDVLLEALEDYAGTLIFVSHDRYFVERLATKIVDVGGGRAELYPGRYAEFLWSKDARASGAAGAARAEGAVPRASSRATGTGTHAHVSASRTPPPAGPGPAAREAAAERRREAAERRRRERALQALRARIADLETRIAGLEQSIKQIEARMATPDFYKDPAAARPVLEEHQSLMWQVGDLLGQWEMLQQESERHSDPQDS